MRLALLYIIITLIGTHASYGQDLIVTKNKDSIPCKITEVGDLFLNYITPTHKKQIKNIPIKHVEAYYFDVIPMDSNTIHYTYKSIAHRFSISGGFGFGYMVAPNPENVQPFIEDYLNELRLGLLYHIQADYQIDPNVTIGISGTRFTTSNRIDRVALLTPFDTSIGPLSDHIKVHQISGLIKVFFGTHSSKWKPYVSAVIGTSFYKNNYELITPYLATSFTTHFGAHIGIESRLDYNWSLFAQLGIQAISFDEFEITDFNRVRKFNINASESDDNSRVDFLVGIKYNLGKLPSFD
ncbi:MAG: hypothetical protein ACK5UI_02060 [Bacteroidota bacterium]|jgi:hypothetical protein